MKRLFLLLVIFLIGCNSLPVVEKSNDVCTVDADCKRFVTNWPCDSVIANNDANIKEDICIEPCPRGASMAFCDWNYREPVCVNKQCTWNLDCAKIVSQVEKNKYLDCADSDISEKSAVFDFSKLCDLYEKC
jgi:hypothetical protein